MKMKMKIKTIATVLRTKTVIVLILITDLKQSPSIVVFTDIFSRRVEKKTRETATAKTIIIIVL